MESAEISEKILPLVDDPKLAYRHHWAAIALCGWLKDNMELVMSYRALFRYLHGQDYARRIPPSQVPAPSVCPEVPALASHVKDAAEAAWPKVRTMEAAMVAERRKGLDFGFMGWE